MQISEIKWMEDPQRFENDVESRLNDLGKLVTGLLGAPYPGWPGERSSDRRTTEEFVVREAALHWIMRVANHSQGAVRKALWLDIEKELRELEMTVDVLMRAECV